MSNLLLLDKDADLFSVWKIFGMCESKSGYTLDRIAYVGRQLAETAHKNLAMEVMQNLMRSTHNFGQNLTVRQNKRNIRKEMNDSTNRALQTFEKDTTMVNYACKKQMRCFVKLGMEELAAAVSPSANSPRPSRHRPPRRELSLPSAKLVL